MAPVLPQLLSGAWHLVSAQKAPGTEAGRVGREGWGGKRENQLQVELLCVEVKDFLPSLMCLLIGSLFGTYCMPHDG